MGKIEPEKEIKKVVICVHTSRRQKTEQHRRGDDGVRRPSGYVLSNKRNTGRRKGKPWKKKKLGALRKN